ncbi:MAG: sulfotransferase family protein [Chloroflexota bacterium]
MSGDPTPMENRYIFLASSAYSGSTLLSFLLGAHPQIGTVSDVSGRRRERKMSTFACSCGLLMESCPFWRSLADELNRTGVDFSLANFRLGFDEREPGWLGRARVRSLGGHIAEATRDRLFRLLPGDERHMRQLGRRNSAFAASVLAVTGGDVFVDASKERLRARYLQRYVDPGLRVIHLVRDVRGVVESTLRRGKLGISATEAARRWAHTNEAIMRSIAAVSPDRQLLVRYEELCTDLVGTMRRLFSFSGVEPDVDVGRFVADEQHLIGNRMRLSGVDEVRLDERWRTSIAPAEIEEIIRSAGDVHAAFYDSAAPTGPTEPATHG